MRQPDLAAHLLTPRIGALARRYLARSFPRRAERKVLIGYTPNRVSWSQIYPFFHYARSLREKTGATIRAVPLADLSGSSLLPDADTVLLQPWFSVSPEDLEQIASALQRQAPDAVVSVLDPNAPNDLRSARHLPEGLRFYGKKTLFRDRDLYQRCWHGDTNLTEYYGEIYGIHAPPVDFRPPQSVVDRLVATPGFFTDARFIPMFSRAGPPSFEGRNLDIQSRLGTRGTPWYQAMREASLRALAAVPDLRISPAGNLSHADYMAEMAQARLCFSPFGYGEICWRDVEAFAAGAVLIKPDMGHLETDPDLYEAGVTYLPIAWDFSDLDHVIRTALADPDRCARIAATAYGRVTKHLTGGGLVRQLAPFIAA